MQQTITNKLKQLTLVIGLTLIALCLQLTLAPKAHATTYDVSQFTDPTGCGFVEAMAAINATPIPGATCAAASAPNTVNLAAGTYTLPPGSPQIQITTDGDLTINGAGAGSTIFDGAGSASGIAFDAPSKTSTYSISNLALRNFVIDSGEQVIFIASGNLNVDKVAVYSNQCPLGVCSAFFNPLDYNSDVNITNSSFFDNTTDLLGYAASFGSSNDCDGTSNGRLNLNVINNTFNNNKSSVALGYAYICSTSDKSNIRMINNTIANTQSPYLEQPLGVFFVYAPSAEVSKPDFFMQNNILFNNNYQLNSRGSNNGQFDEPNGIALDNSGNIYVADTYNNRIQVFNSSGVYQSQFGTSGSGDGQFNNPRGIALDSSGNIYVADMDNNRIQKFNSAGVYQSQFGSSSSSYGSGDGQLHGPQGIALSSSGNTYVIDTGNNRFEVFDSAGNYVSQVPATNPLDNNCPKFTDKDGNLIPGIVTPTSLGGNISSDNTCSTFFTAPNDKNNTDTQLGSLTSEYPFVMPIAKTSPAFNNGIASGAPSTDERGVARPQYGAFDSGAYELADPANTGNLASTGFDMKIPAIVASILALSGIAVAGYSLKRK